MGVKVGVVVHFSQKGFGFLFSPDVNRRVFFHSSQWHRATDPQPGDEVTFQFAPGQVTSKPDIAIKVTPTGNRISISRTAGAASVGGAQ
jgi:cold shock CspA family protein